MKDFKLPIAVKIVIGLLFISIVISLISNVYSSFTGLYNSTTTYKLEYKSLEQNQLTTFDNNYLIFKDKSNIANLNKETFITVTQIIMSARKDGMNVAWKWTHENQQIPYSEFTEFYKDLSAFTTTRYTENNSIERNKQSIVKKHNTMLIMFPGILYNHFLKIEPIIYKEGFISKETKTLFGK